MTFSFVADGGRYMLDGAAPPAARNTSWDAPIAVGSGEAAGAVEAALLDDDMSEASSWGLVAVGCSATPAAR